MPPSTRARLALAPTCSWPSVRPSLALAALLFGLGANAQALPPPEPASVSGGSPAGAPGALPSEAPAKEPELVPASQPAPPPEAERAPRTAPGAVPAGAVAPEPQQAEPPPPSVQPRAAPSPLPDAPVFETRVEAPAPTSTASAETVRDRDLQLRFFPTPEDILRVVPGLVIAQHQGGGKADQLFLRGFDADHGTDVALSIDGVPINLPSNGHGQGFADLHFLIPETIDRVEVTKGPYFVETGDFDTAGAVNFRTRRSFAENSVTGEYGSFDTWRVVGIVSPFGKDSATWFAAEMYGTNGPFLSPENLLRYNLFLKSSFNVSPSTRITLLGTAYGSQWSASGQIPAPFVTSGQLNQFGAIDPTEGGQTQRQMLILTLESRPSPSDSFILTAYFVHFSLRLFNDFTFQLTDAVNFDEIEQDDQRYYLGFNAEYKKRVDVGELRTVTTLGAKARLDTMNVALWHVKQRVRLADCAPATDDSAATPNPCDDADITQSDLSAYAQEDVRFNRWSRVLLGVRSDLFEWNVTSQLPFNPDPPPGTNPNQGTAIIQKAIVNPKLQAVFTPVPIWDIYVDGGGGFHSNDARAIVAQNGVGALPRAWGAELGNRLSLLDGRLDVAAALWFLHLQSEFVFDADVGQTEAAGPTNRYGLDAEGRLQILSWLWADLDVSLAHAVYTQDQGNGNAVALAPRFTGQAGLSVLHPAGLPGFKARISARWVGPRPATPDGSLTATGYFIVDLYSSYRWRFLEFGLAITNLLNSTWREAQFATTYQVREAPYNQSVPVTNIAFTPGNPIALYATATVYF
jgi:outer membrane receptor protein involved in Fe transport